MISATSPSISLSIENLSYASIKYTLPGGSASHAETKEQPAQTANTGASNSDAPHVQDMLQKVKKSVFQIEIRDADKQPIAHGTGFLVNANGLAVTNYHVIESAVSASARFVDHHAWYDLELVAVRPDLDLAVLQIQELNGAFDPLLFSTNDPHEGDEVWALGYPEGLGFTINKGTVNGLRTIDELPSELSDVKDRYAQNPNGSRWIALLITAIQAARS